VNPGSLIPKFLICFKVFLHIHDSNINEILQIALKSHYSVIIQTTCSPIL